MADPKPKKKPKKSEQPAVDASEHEQKLLEVCDAVGNAHGWDLLQRKVALAIARKANRLGDEADVQAEIHQKGRALMLKRPGIAAEVKVHEERAKSVPRKPVTAVDACLRAVSAIGTHAKWEPKMRVKMEQIARAIGSR